MKSNLDYYKEWLDALPAYTKFSTIDTSGEKRRAQKEENGSLFVYAKGKKRYGTRYTETEKFLHWHTPVIPKAEDEDKKWHNSLKRALKEMDRTGCWKGTSVYDMYTNLLKMSKQDHDDMYHLYWDGLWENGWNYDNPELAKYREKYPFAFDQDGNVITDYLFELSNCNLKTTYFGKYETESVRSDAARAIADGRDYSSGRISSNYDYGFEFVVRDGVKRAWWSAEYKGCGNGHYYLALSERLAVFAEND